MPAVELATFETNYGYAKEIAASANALSNLVTAAVDFSDMYRAALVQGVSAFDYYIHDEVRARMLIIFAAAGGSWPGAYARFRVPLSSVREALLGSGVSGLRQGWLEEQIRDQHQTLSFQQPERVADAIRLVSDVRLWDSVASHMSIARQGNLTPDQVVKNRLKLIIDRRNLIAHEADLDPTPPRSRRYPMNRTTAEEALEFISQTAHAIAAVI